MSKAMSAGRRPFPACLLALCLLIANPAAALATDTETADRIIAEGNSQGAPACNSCHGANGEGMAAAGFPRLAGLGKAYLLEQLDAFSAGTRRNEVMHPIAKALSAAERRALAEHYSELPQPVQVSWPLPEPRPGDGAAWLAARGRWSDNLPACAQCHGPTGMGVGEHFPPLAGQPAAYIAAQLRGWKAGLRPPGPLALMVQVAVKLTEPEIAALADYYAALPKGGAAPPAPGVAMLAATLPEATDQVQNGRFQPPAETRLPAGEFGETVRQGERIFLDTRTHAGEYVGNALSCANCHLDAGRHADSAPLWGAFGAYPAYRSKNRHVNTFAERIQGCFTYSMNGKPPPLGDPVLVALETYAFWLAKGVPVGSQPAGSGYPELPQPPKPPDYARGERLFVANCALCHGADGRGQRSDGHVAFPPLWGPESFNWGAGMHRIGTAASFIRANMPLGMGGTLGVQDAWDLAMFMNSHDRPQDPRFEESVEATRRKHHDTWQSMYGRTVNGTVLEGLQAQ